MNYKCLDVRLSFLATDIAAAYKVIKNQFKVVKNRFRDSDSSDSGFWFLVSVFLFCGVGWTPRWRVGACN